MSNLEKDLNPDVFIGISLPLDYGSQGFFNKTKTTLQQTRSNIRNLLLTIKGERLGNPTFGSNLLSVIFGHENTDVESRIEEEIRAAMGEWLPFINIVSIESNFSNTNRNAVNVSLRFTLNVDVTSEADLTLDLSNYSNEGSLLS